MTHIQVLKYSKALSRLGLGFGSVLLIVGVVTFSKNMSSDFDTNFLSGDWNSVLNIIQGLLLTGFSINNLLNRKYFIEWDKQVLRFRLLNSKQVEVIKFSDIEKVNIKLFEIVLQLPNRKRTLDINNLKYEDLKTIKTKFEAIQHEKNKQAKNLSLQLDSDIG